MFSPSGYRGLIRHCFGTLHWAAATSGRRRLPWVPPRALQLWEEEQQATPANTLLWLSPLGVPLSHILNEVAAGHSLPATWLNSLWKWPPAMQLPQADASAGGDAQDTSSSPHHAKRQRVESMPVESVLLPLSRMIQRICKSYVSCFGVLGVSRSTVLTKNFTGLLPQLLDVAAFETFPSIRFSCNNVLLFPSDGWKALSAADSRYEVPASDGEEVFQFQGWVPVIDPMSWQGSDWFLPDAFRVAKPRLRWGSQAQKRLSDSVSLAFPCGARYPDRYPDPDLGDLRSFQLVQSLFEVAAACWEFLGASIQGTLGRSRDLPMKQSVTASSVWEDLKSQEDLLRIHSNEALQNSLLPICAFAITCAEAATNLEPKRGSLTHKELTQTLRDLAS